MHNGIRQPAFQAAQPPAATPIDADPSRLLEKMYRRIWETSMREMSFVNPALAIEAVGFRRWEAPVRDAGDSDRPVAKTASGEQPLAGDWVGALITPWFLNLFLLPGGGTLWRDRRPGERCPVEFPIGPLVFITDYDSAAEIPYLQYCPLFAPPGAFSNQAAARAAAVAALSLLVYGPAAPENSREVVSPPQSKRTSRRDFLKRIAGD